MIFHRPPPVPPRGPDDPDETWMKLLFVVFILGFACFVVAASKGLI